MENQVIYSDKDIENTILKQLYQAIKTAAKKGERNPFSEIVVTAGQLAIAIAKTEDNDDKETIFRTSIIEAQITKVAVELANQGFVLINIQFSKEFSGGSGTLMMTPIGFEEAQKRYENVAAS